MRKQSKISKEFLRELAVTSSPAQTIFATAVTPRYECNSVPWYSLTTILVSGGAICIAFTFRIWNLGNRMTNTKKMVTAVAFASISSLSMAGPLAPVIGVLTQVDNQLGALIGGAGGLPGLDALPLDPMVLLTTLPALDGSLIGLDALPSDPSALLGGGLPSLDVLRIDPSTLLSGGLPNVTDYMALLNVGLPTIPGLTFLPIDPGALLGGSLPGLDALPLDVVSILSGGPVPGLSVLPIDVFSVIGGDSSPGLDALPIDILAIASLQPNY
jgi:hypothetical protein